MQDNEATDPEFGRPILVNTLSSAQLTAWIVIGVVMLAVAVAAWSYAGGSPAGPHAAGRHADPSPAPYLCAAMSGIFGLILIGLAVKNLAAGGTQRKIFYERGVGVTQGSSVRSLAYRDARVRSFIFRRTEHVLELYPVDGSPVIRAGVTTSSSAVKRQQFLQLKEIVAAACAGPYDR